MASTFNCPTCGAPLHTNGTEADIICEYCGASVIVPAELRQNLPTQPVQAVSQAPMPTFQADDPVQRRALLRQGMQLIRGGRLDEAASLLSSVTGSPLSATRPMIDRIASAMGNSGRINPIELMAMLSQISPGEDFWTPSQAQNVPVYSQARSTPRRRGGGAGCLIIVLVAVGLYVSSSSPAHIISQVATVFNQFLRLLH